MWDWIRKTKMQRAVCPTSVESLFLCFYKEIPFSHWNTFQINRADQLLRVLEQCTSLEYWRVNAFNSHNIQFLLEKLSKWRIWFWPKHNLHFLRAYYKFTVLRRPNMVNDSWKARSQTLIFMLFIISFIWLLLTCESISFAARLQLVTILQ